MKALATLGGCRGSPEPLLVALVCDIKVPFCHELAHFMFPITRKLFQKKKKSLLAPKLQSEFDNPDHTLPNAK